MKLKNFINDYNPKNHFKIKPYIIAEAGVNHEGSMDIAKRLIDEACEGGANAIKFQSYKAKTLASKNSPSYWDLTKEPTTSQYELFKKHDSFWKNEFEILKKYCDEVKIEFLSTPFDIESANFLNDLMDVYKISSSDITNKPFIEHMCSFNKPILLSTGASNLEEINKAVSWIKKYGNSLSLLHCILNYPTKDINANLGMILDLKEKFSNYIIGYSDHTLPGEMDILISSYLLGAIILEKHFTHDKTLPGNDHYHAMDKNDLIKYNQKINKCLTFIGELNKNPLETENISRENARRSLVAKRNIPKGHIVSYDDLTFKRPASGICPSQIDKVIGKFAISEIKEDDIIYWDLLRNDF